MATTLLIIDDDQVVRTLLHQILSKEYTVFTAECVAGATALLGTHVFDILFLDINLPDGIGFGIIPIARLTNPYLKIIVCSAFDGEEERTQALASGAHAFLAKPIDKHNVALALAEVELADNLSSDGTT